MESYQSSNQWFHSLQAQNMKMPTQLSAISKSHETVPCLLPSTILRRQCATECLRPLGRWHPDGVGQQRHPPAGCATVLQGLVTQQRLSLVERLVAAAVRAPVTLVCRVLRAASWQPRLPHRPAAAATAAVSLPTHSRWDGQRRRSTWHNLHDDTVPRGTAAAAAAAAAPCGNCSRTA